MVPGVVDRGRGHPTGGRDRRSGWCRGRRTPRPGPGGQVVVGGSPRPSCGCRGRRCWPGRSGGRCPRRDGPPGPGCPRRPGRPGSPPTPCPTPSTPGPPPDRSGSQPGCARSGVIVGLCEPHGSRVLRTSRSTRPWSSKTVRVAGTRTQVGQVCAGTPTATAGRGGARQRALRWPARRWPRTRAGGVGGQRGHVVGGDRRVAQVAFGHRGAVPGSGSRCGWSAQRPSEDPGSGLFDGQRACPHGEQLVPGPSRPAPRW